MQYQVEEKIRELKQQQREEYYRRKKADLNQWGLQTKKSGSKKAPLVVTDEEYDALVEASNGLGMPSRNAIARALNISSLFVLSLSIIAAFALANLVESLGWLYAVLAIAGGIIVFLLLRGVAEAVYLLQQLVDARQNEAAAKPKPFRQEFPQEQPDVEESFLQTQETAQTEETYPFE